MGSLVESHWWSVLKNIRWYNLIKTYMRKIWLNLIKTYLYRWLNISMLRINSTEWKLRWGRVKMYFGGNLWKWILLPLASSWQLMPDSGMASKVAIWVGSDKVKQLRIPRSDCPVNLALKLCRMFWCLWNHPKFKVDLYYHWIDYWIFLLNIGGLFENISLNIGGGLCKTVGFFENHISNPIPS